jgi:tetratricopeptide (TPR) repeat protein
MALAPELELARLLDELRDHLGYRRISHGIALLEEAMPLVRQLAPGQPRAGECLGLIAQWVDAGFRDTNLLQELLERFPPETRHHLRLIDYLHLRMAEGVRLMAEEDFERAAAHFRFVDSMGAEVRDRELLAIAAFWTGRCLRRMGQYDDALSFTQRGERLAIECGYGPMAAIMQVTQSWLAFMRGKLSEAIATLRTAEAALSLTDDYLTRGNVQSAYGRIARRQGRHEQALEYFERAIAEYRQGGGGQLQLARSLLNIAFVQRLVALQLQQTLDTGAALRRSAGDAAPNAEPAREVRQRIEQIRSEARSQLRESLAIYLRFRNYRGTAGVHINQGSLHLDSGDLEAAGADAAEAYGLGEEKHDLIVMARARTLQCMVEVARMDEQIGDPEHHHETASRFAAEAVALAGQTQNRRLAARAWVWQGLTASTGAGADLDRARQCCEQAIALLQTQSGEREYVWADLAELKDRVLHARPLDPQLKAWSVGQTNGLTFQQLTEEFGRVVIPRVWEREGRKVSRVATLLSVSPKKVRRILRAAGLLES